MSSSGAAWASHHHICLVDIDTIQLEGPSEEGRQRSTEEEDESAVYHVVEEGSIVS